MSNSTMIGFGLTMEGINQNYVMYEFALERGWDQLTVSAEKWFDQYALTRYGFASVPLQAAWQQLRVGLGIRWTIDDSIIYLCVHFRLACTRIVDQRPCMGNI